VIARARITASGRCSACGKLQVRLETNGMGKVVEIPAPCSCPASPKRAKKPLREGVDHDRRRAGICQDCDQPVAGKLKVSLRCAEHTKAARAASVKRHIDRLPPERKPWRLYQARHPERARASSRATYQNDPGKREERNEYKRRYRKLNRHKTRAQKKRAAVKNAAQQAKIREEIKAGVRQRRPSRRKRNGERLCITPGCVRVLTGRPKKCEYCKHREAREAVEFLAPRRGHGRRRAA